MRKEIFRYGLALALFFLCCFTGHGQQFIPLWPEGKKPNSNGKKLRDSIYNERTWQVATPGIYAFPVPKSENKGTAVLICPGGGYERVSHVYNGFQFARWLNANGINAFVLVYRLPHQTDLVNRQLAPLQDAQRAIRFLQAHASDFSLSPAKIGVMGISAGGHVASSLATHPKQAYSGIDSIDAHSFGPAFQILLSPVITMGAQAHKGSRKNFLGADSSATNVKAWSNELQVNASTVPAFIVHAQNDSSVSVQNSLLYFTSLISHKVSASLHVFPQGGHGIRLADNPGSTELWLDLLLLWMREKGFNTAIN